ncbi:MAG: hypothetical protein IT306_24055 [Chloroflexi bacterium]|nr:hypothetical protein [Chloroflexota bacterium]
MSVGLTSGALALSVLSWGGGALPAPVARTVQAEDIDCYNDKDLYDLPECVERRALDRRSGNQQNEAQGAGGQPAGGDQQQSSGGGQPSGGGDQQQTSSGGGQPAGGGDQQQAGGGQPAGGGQQQPPQQQAAAEEEEDGEKPEPPRGPLNDPKEAILTIKDAGKEATQYISDEGTDKYGKFARNRFERDRSNGASALGPNVIDNKVWVAKDVETAKALFKEQAAIKNFPERKEGVQGPVEKIKPTKYGEEFNVETGFYQDEKIWHHYRFVMRVGNVVSVIYLFGREEFFQDEKDRGWTGQGDWYTSTVFHRM